MYVKPELVSPGASGLQLPTVVADAGERAGRRFVEFFTANIRNPNTRAAYARAVGEFFAWLEERGVSLERVEPVIVAAYVEELGMSKAAPSVKQSLAAIRMLFDWMVLGQVLPMNPAASVRGPRHVVRRGKTPVLSTEQARQLLDSIGTSDVAGLRDRALIGLMVYSFARVSAAVGMRVEDCFSQGKRWWFRGPHFSTCAWCNRRSSSAVRAAVSPSSLPQSSTGRFNAEPMVMRSLRCRGPASTSLRLRGTPHYGASCQ